MGASKLLDLFTDTARLYTNYVERQLSRFGIHSGQGSIISALDILGPCSQKELADFRRVSPATISVMLRRMEARGLIRRTPSEDGGKRNLIVLTEAGRGVADTLKHLLPQGADQLFEGLTEEELAVAERVFRTICENIDKK